MHFENALLAALALLPLALAGPRRVDTNVSSKIPTPSSTATLDVTSTLAAAVPTRTGPDPDGPIEIPEWDFDETIKSGYWFVKHYMSWCHYSRDAAPGWYDTALTYTRSNVSLTHPFPMTVPFTEFYNFNFASYECSGAKGELCGDPDLKIESYPAFNLYKDGIFIEQWGGGDHDTYIEGFALFVEEFLNEKFPGTRKPMDLSAPWSAAAREAAEKDTKKWAPNTAMLREEAKERSLKELRKIWGVPEVEEEIADNAQDEIEDVVEAGKKDVKKGTKDVEDVVGEVADVLKDVADDIEDANEDIEIKLNEELDDEKIVEKSSAIDRLHRIIKGIFHIHPGWYSQQVTH
ncbi:hypothetical protein L873DRAFT_1844794 [Choiromyces venosus 120613-1]|uniref:Thioredoxin domain-containing protein n=1 Tax=Choiromyces venosus 120613-1 TaxID=1336337 RepID=A0A3N4JGN8_9PEZI|nr:hypothetical protein L873DRAFT_1844794 [Choiromyces venosus 120613-1]